MAVWTTEEVQNTIQSMMDKAVSDSEFRQSLLENPKAAIKEFTGKEMPESFSLKLIEADPAVDMTFVLPPLQTDELSDQELDQVAGGRRDCPSLDTCEFDNTSTTVTYAPSFSV